jgi:hypothetical protein
MLSDYDKSIDADDYVGRWFRTEQSGESIIYSMIEFDDNGKLKTKRYTVSGDDVTCTDTVQLYGEYDEGDKNDKILEVHNSNYYYDVTLYRWSIEGNTLSMSTLGEGSVTITYHFLTPADIKQMEELDKQVK